MDDEHRGMKSCGGLAAWEDLSQNTRYAASSTLAALLTGFVSLDSLHLEQQRGTLNIN